MVPQEHGAMGMMGMHHPHMEMMEKLWEKLDEKQVNVLIGRMIDGKIIMKEAWIKYLQHKIETYKLVKQMLEKKK
jgi:hypothetical protein